MFYISFTGFAFTVKEVFQSRNDPVRFKDLVDPMMVLIEYNGGLPEQVTDKAKAVEARENRNLCQLGIRNKFIGQDCEQLQEI